MELKGQVSMSCDVIWVKRRFTIEPNHLLEQDAVHEKLIFTLVAKKHFGCSEIADSFLTLRLSKVRIILCTLLGEKFAITKFKIHSVINS